MISKRLTFDQALARENTSILRVQKSRLSVHMAWVTGSVGAIARPPTPRTETCDDLDS